MKLEELHTGDILTFWFDTGAMGPQICYAQVVRKAKVKILVLTEWGNEQWVYPGVFNRKLTANDWRPKSLGGAEE